MHALGERGREFRLALGERCRGHDSRTVVQTDRTRRRAVLHHGHRDFILCLGYLGDVIHAHFRALDPTGGEVLPGARTTVRYRPHGAGMDGWTVTCVDTGSDANIGMRLKAVESHLAGEEFFLANYADGLSDLDLTAYLERFRASDLVASFLCVRPHLTFHVVDADAEGLVRDIRPVSRAELWINAGFFAFRRGILDVMREGEELVVEPFQRLLAEGKLRAHREACFWQCMDTFRDKQTLEDLVAGGAPPWRVWERPSDAKETRS